MRAMIVGERTGGLARSLEGVEIEVERPPDGLSARGGDDVEQIAASIVALEELLIDDSPDAVLLTSGSNDALAAALVATRLQIPVVSLEDGPQGEDPLAEINGRLIHQLADVTLTDDAELIAAWLRDRARA